MNVPHYSALAARLLKRDATPRVPEAAELAAGMRAIQLALAARQRRQRWSMVAAALAVAAAAALLWLGASGAGYFGRRTPGGSVAVTATPKGSGASIFAGQRDAPLLDGASLSPGNRLDTPAGGGAQLSLSTGTCLELSGGSGFTVQSQGDTQRFLLSAGSLSARVAKLSIGQRFIVNTPDAEVEVRGTIFKLSVLERAEACGSGARTRLFVQEGVVEVRGANAPVRVRAGERWPADCEEEPTALPPPLVEGAPAGSGSGGERSAKPVAAARPPLVSATEARAAQAGAAPERPEPSEAGAARSSALSAQNDLFAEAVAARQNGDVRGALRAYEQLIVAYPGSPLAENAMLERMRLLRGGQAAAARREAERYLARYPKGFARDEARELTASAP